MRGQNPNTKYTEVARTYRFIEGAGAVGSALIETRRVWYGPIGLIRKGLVAPQGAGFAQESKDKRQCIYTLFGVLAAPLGDLPEGTPVYTQLDYHEEYATVYNLTYTLDYNDGGTYFVNNIRPEFDTIEEAETEAREAMRTNPAYNYFKVWEMRDGKSWKTVKTISR